MAKTCFETPAWHAAVAGMLSSDSGEAIADNLFAGIDQAVEHNGACIMAFHVDAPPEVLHHTLEPEREKHYLKRYIAGPYLLDPLYELALRRDKPGICRFRDASPDRFHSSEYYRQYCDRTHLADEMDFLVDVDERTALVLVIGRLEKMFKKSELSRLQLIEPTVRAAMRRIWQRRRQSSRRTSDPDIHRRLTECYDTFGDGVLTRREREITQLLLRGHSTKSVARQLDIAPGTVMVHKRNLFQKLCITSQFELFSRFIEELSR